MFKMLRDVGDEAILVRKAQIEKDVSVHGSFRATKIMDRDERTCIVVTFGVDQKGHSKGTWYSVESDCLVEVLDGNA